MVLCSVGGAAVGAILLVGALFELSAYWAKGHTGMFGPEFSVVISALIYLAGGAACGVVAGSLAAAGVSLARWAKGGWVAQASGAAVGALTVVGLAIVAFNLATPLLLLLGLGAAALGPFGYVALCSRPTRQSQTSVDTWAKAGGDSTRPHQSARQVDDHLA